MQNSSTHCHRWSPPAGVRVQPYGVYLLHGTGEHAGRYERLASRLAANGWRVGAHDHPGHGQSAGQRGLIDPAGALATQAGIQIQTFARETDSTPILFGHSLGGALAAELVLEHHLSVTGLILSAPALAPKVSSLDKLKLKLLTAAAPRLCLDLGYDPDRLTHDDEEKAIAIADPLMHSFKSATLINWMFQSGARSLENASQLTVETLLLIAGADPVVDSDKTRLFASRADKDTVTVHEYDDYLHELLNETPDRRERTTVDIERWLERFEGRG